MSYKRVGHPSEVLNIGDTLRVQIVRINRETQRISLGMKQLEQDPWITAAANYPVDSRHKGRVTNITEYGAFVELEPGIEGLVHVSEMSWVKKNVHPGKIVSTSQEVEVLVLEVDEEKRRISLGLKQAQRNPWEVFAEEHPAGSIVEGEVKNATEFGLFVGLDGDVDGMVHMSDIAWGLTGEQALAAHHKGERIRAKVLEVDVEKERISLSIKEMDDSRAAPPSPMPTAAATCARTRSSPRPSSTTATAASRSRSATTARRRSSSAATSAATATSSDPSASRSARRSTRWSSASTAARSRRSASRRCRSPRKSRRSPSTGRADSGASLGDILGAALNKAKDSDKG